MIKKISLVVTAALFASTGFAATTGWYAGAVFGRDSGSIKSDENYTTVIPGATITQNIKSQHHLSDYLFGAHVGYDAPLTTHLMLGSEIFANRSNAKMTWRSNLPATQREFQKLGSFGVSLLPGWQINNNNRLFARLGWIRSEFEHETNDNVTYGPAFKHNHRDGIELGIGWQTAITPHSSLRLEYDHSSYSSINTHYRNFVQNTSTTNGDFSYKPRFDQFTVGVNYYFAPNTSTIKTTAATLNDHGLYLGSVVGRSNVRLELNRHIPNNETNNYSYGLTGYVGGLQLGYRWALDHHISLALETFALINSSEMDYNDHLNTTLTEPTTEQYKLREKTSYGLSILPGYKINTSSMVYARLGMINSKFEKQGDASEFQGPLLNVSQRGFQMGLGYELAITNSVSLFGEYDHTSYSEIHTSLDNRTFDYKPQDNFYKIGVNYHF